MQQWIHEPSNSLLVLGDFNCSYHIFPYSVDPNVDIVIKGQYPHARYMSITVNGQGDIPIASAPDYALIPDPGSTNPFLPGADWEAEYRSFTLIIRSAPPPGQDHFVPGAGRNIVYVGTLPNGKPNSGGIITLRVYVPGIGYDANGGVPLPEITYCPARTFWSKDNAGALYFQNIVLESYVIEKPQHRDKFKNADKCCDIAWSKPNAVQSVALQANPNTFYILSDQINRNPCNLLFFRWKAPVVPDTYHNIGIVGDEDMRYWSMMFTTGVGFMGLYTIGDFQTVKDKHGYVNLVISFGAERPASVTPENGFTWVNLTHLPLIPFSIIYRNTLISPTFPYTAKNVPANQVVPPELMGEYYPCGRYVDPSYFDICPVLPTMK